MTLPELADILANCRFGDWTFVCIKNDDTLYLRVCADTVDNVTGGRLSWCGRKWHVSSHATKSEVVQTAFKAVMTALEHEARERFQYRGRAVLGPHFDVDCLWNLADGKHEDIRL